MQKADAERIEEFLTRHVPNALLIGTTNVHCKELRDDLQAICDHILEHNPQARLASSVTAAAFATMASCQCNRTISCMTLDWVAAWLLSICVWIRHGGHLHSTASPLCLWQRLHQQAQVLTTSSPYH